MAEHVTGPIGYLVAKWWHRRSNGQATNRADDDALQNLEKRAGPDIGPIGNCAGKERGDFQGADALAWDAALAAESANAQSWITGV